VNKIWYNADINLIDKYNDLSKKLKIKFNKKAYSFREIIEIALNI
jgi:hypothetical protein